MNNHLLSLLISSQMNNSTFSNGLSSFSGNNQGVVIIDNTIELDAHLFSLIVPVFLIALMFVFKKRIIKASNGKKAFVTSIFGIVMLSLFLVQMYDFAINVLMHHSSASLELFTIFYNIDSLLLFASGIAMLISRFSILRTVTPLGIVIGFANLINNPGAHVTYTTIASSIALCVLPLLVVVMKGKTISFKELSVSLIFALTSLILIATINSLNHSDFSLLNPKVLSRNKVYSSINQGFLRIALFIVLVVLIEIFAWICINVFVEGKIINVMKFIRVELANDNKKLLDSSYVIFDVLEFDSYDLIENEQAVAEEIGTLPIIIVDQEHESDEVYTYTSIILSKVFFARSPSF